MVIIDGYGQPYNMGDILKYKTVRPVEDSRSTRKVAQQLARDSDMPSHSKKFDQAIHSYRAAEHPKKTQTRALFLAEAIMSSPVVYCSPKKTLKEAWGIISENKIRHLPISVDGKKIVGILSDRDILKSNDNALVENVMCTRVLTSLAKTEIREIARAFFEERIGCMPIINDNQEMIGIVTRSDILRTLMNNAPLELWG